MMYIAKFPDTGLYFKLTHLLGIAKAEHFDNFAEAVGECHEGRQFDELFVGKVFLPRLQMFVAKIVVILCEDRRHLQGCAFARRKDGVVYVPRRINLFLRFVNLLRRSRADGTSVAAATQSRHAYPHELLREVIHEAVVKALDPRIVEDVE